METVLVTAAIIKDGAKYLIAQRKKGAHQGMKWEFPGGKVERGEDPETCLKREIWEELNITIDVEEIFKVVSFNYEEKHIVLLCYTCRIVEGEPVSIDCHDFRWVTPKEMRQYEFAPADQPVVDKLNI